MTYPTPTRSEKLLNKNDFIVSKTDPNGKILYGNKMFIDISGYEEKELLGAPHSILRHPDMPKVIFELLWKRIQKKEEVFAYVKNLCKDGSFYWVFANVTATLDSNGIVRDFHSVRRKASQKAMQVIPALYSSLLQAERSGGINASRELLHQELQKKGADYDSFILSLS